MKIRHFRWLFIAVLLLEMAGLIFSGEPQAFGASAEWTTDCYQFGGGTAPWAIGSGIAFLYVLLMDATPVVGGRPLPGLLRRYAAFWLDFLLGMFVVAPIVGLLSLFVEWRRTQVFAWTFTRAIPAASDIPVTVVSLILAGIALLFYFAILILRNRPSPGACILGYQVLPDDGAPLSLRRALLRCLLGFIAVGVPWAALFVRRDRSQGKFWLDKVFNTRATLLS